MEIVKHPESRQLVRTVKASAYVFEDQNSKRLMSYIEQIAPSEATVLIIGETGTGKELVARQIHEERINLSLRSIVELYRIL